MDSDTSLPDTEISNEDDSSDEEVNSQDDIVESDEERTEVVFESDIESEELENDTYSYSNEDEDDDDDSNNDYNDDDDNDYKYSDDDTDNENRNHNSSESEFSESDFNGSNSNDSDSNESYSNSSNANSIANSTCKNNKVQKKVSQDIQEQKCEKSNVPMKTIRILDAKKKNGQSNKFKLKTMNQSSTNPTESQVENTESFANEKSATNTNKNIDEYEYDTSDEEDIRNTIGNIPVKWYDEYPQIGYDTEGRKILKPQKGDQLDNFLKRMEDPDFWRTIKDPQTGQDVILSEADIELITRIQKQKIPDAQFDEYAPWIEWFTSEVEKMPLRNFPEHKRSFLPSRDEAKKVSRLVHALKMGWIKSTAEMERERQQKKNEPQFYMLWSTDDQAEEMRRIHKHIPAPKRFLPGHAESYNPPPEYLFDSKEMKQWEKLKQTPWKRKLHFIPQKFQSLREVPAYPKFIKERFQRCLDLYLCPRAIKMKVTVQPEDLVPQLPNPKDLQPFPKTLSMIYKGHTDMVRSISIEATGQFFASGGDDMNLKIWEVATGRCVKTIPCGGVIRCVAWSPKSKTLNLIAVAADKKVILINPGVGDHLITKKTDELLEIIPQSETITNERVKSAVQWESAEGDNAKNGMRIILNHFKIVKQVTWHGKGDYLASVMPDGLNRSVLIHQLSKRRSQLPFTKSKGLIQSVLFHPIRPYLFVATQKNVRIYDLMKQELVKKLFSNSQWISTMAIHPGGDNILVATYDRKMLWFDLDLSSKPYQTLRLHGTGVRGVAFHKHYPLFASGADDRALIVSHGMVYNDLLQNPLIVPLKRLCDHKAYNDFGILDVMFHPTQPWVFSAGADATILLYV